MPDPPDRTFRNFTHRVFALTYDCVLGDMNLPSRLFGVIAPWLSLALERAFRVRLAALALPLILVLAAPCVSAAPADGEHPGPGEKIVRSTIGTTPQALTAAERAKLALPPADPAPVSVLRPAPWWPPEWRAQLQNGGARPARKAAAQPNSSRTATPGATAVGRPAHVAPSATKPPAVRTIGYGARDASPAEIGSKRPAAPRPDGGR